MIIHLSHHFDQEQINENNHENQFQSKTYSPFEQIDTKCPYCHSEFSNPYFLAMHTDNKHMLESNEYYCRICEQRHTSLLELIAHLNLCHCGLEMPYFCNVCSFLETFLPSQYKNIPPSVKTVMTWLVWHRGEIFLEIFPALVCVWKMPVWEMLNKSNLNILHVMHCRLS